MKRSLLLGVCFYSISVMAQQRYAVIIDEIMADPSPPNGLPNHEWIELKNRSSVPINLQNWRIGDAGGLSGPMPAFLLQPGAFVIVCSQSASATMSVFGDVIPVTSFPSLDNEGEQLFLRAANGHTIHAVEYHSSWYRNELKQQGGWTLEMVDTDNPCSGFNNWKACLGAAGGTPGQKNSTDAINTDATAPQLKRSYTTDSITIILVFDEPVDSLTAAVPFNYSIDHGIGIVSVATIAPIFNEVQLKTTTPLLAGTIYTISATGIRDCQNNTVNNSSARTGLPADPLPREWIINEILFNPRPNGYDYTEFYNHSDKIIDVSKLYIANRNSSGVISNIQALSNTPYYIFPGDHIVVTENAELLALHYLVSQPANVLVLSSMPSYPDDEGTILALNSQGVITDELRYSEDWHHPLIVDNEGVALERIDPAGITQDKTNWHSAASTAGYGTPGYKNSQYKRPEIIEAAIEVKPAVFSPDNDGREDIISIHYRLQEPGYMANITIFDAAGRPVRYFVRNNVLGVSGYWNWDGLNDRGGSLPPGIYIVLTELFNMQGKTTRYKNTIVLAGKLH